MDVLLSFVENVRNKMGIEQEAIVDEELQQAERYLLKLLQDAHEQPAQIKEIAKRLNLKGLRAGLVQPLVEELREIEKNEQ